MLSSSIAHDGGEGEATRSKKDSPSFDVREGGEVASFFLLIYSEKGEKGKA